MDLFNLYKQYKPELSNSSIHNYINNIERLVNNNYRSLDKFEDIIDDINHMPGYRIFEMLFALMCVCDTDAKYKYYDELISIISTLKAIEKEDSKDIDYTPIKPNVD